MHLLPAPLSHPPAAMVLLLVSNQSSRWQCIFINFLGGFSPRRWPTFRHWAQIVYLSYTHARTTHGLLWRVVIRRISLSLSHDDTAAAAASAHSLLCDQSINIDPREEFPFPSNKFVQNFQHSTGNRSPTAAATKTFTTFAENAQN